MSYLYFKREILAKTLSSVFDRLFNFWPETFHLAILDWSSQSVLFTTIAVLTFVKIHMLKSQIYFLEPNIKEVVFELRRYKYLSPTGNVILFLLVHVNMST